MDRVLLFWYAPTIIAKQQVNIAVLRQQHSLLGRVHLADQMVHTAHLQRLCAQAEEAVALFDESCNERNKEEKNTTLKR